MLPRAPISNRSTPSSDPVLIGTLSAWSTGDAGAASRPGYRTAGQPDRRALRHASPETLGGLPDVVGPSTAVVEGTERQLDVLIATAEAVPTDRSVLAIGEAKAGKTVGTGHLTDLERARSALGTRAAQAKLLLFAPAFTPALADVASRRTDVELVNLDRLYYGT